MAGVKAKKGPSATRRKPVSRLQRERQKAFGLAVRAARADDLSQEEVAARADVHRNYLGRIERGELNPSLANMARIADGLGVPLHSLLQDLPEKKRRSS